jgi:uncharacterized lipoprotein YajG
MFIQKNIKIVFILFAFLLFTGCIKKLDSDGLICQQFIGHKKVNSI